MRQNMIWFVRVVLFLHLAKDDPKVFVVIKTVEDGSCINSNKTPLQQQEETAAAPTQDPHPHQQLQQQQETAAAATQDTHPRQQPI